MTHLPTWTLLFAAAPLVFLVWQLRRGRSGARTPLVCLVVVIALAVWAAVAFPHDAAQAAAVIGLVFAWGAAMLGVGAAVESLPSAVRRAGAAVARRRRRRVPADHVRRRAADRPA